MDFTNNIVVHIKQGNCEYLQFRRLLKYSNIKHAYCIKPANFSLKNTKETNEVINNYINLCECIGVDYNKLIKPHQMHTNNVKSVEKVEDKLSLEMEMYDNTDGLVTNKEEVVLATTNADCIILILFDPEKNVIANIHSGWKGTFKKIAINAVNKMVEEYNSNPKNIICCICPSIRKCHFEVEEDVKNMCQDIFAYTNRTEEFIEYAGNREGKDKWLIDTVLINKIMLQDAGLLPENIVDSGICSVCNSNYIHSYRVEGKNYGLNSAVISIKEKC